ncbi:MAG: hypothetical protein AB8B93_00870 [Pseudomonadales bacterium]
MRESKIGQEARRSLQDLVDSLRREREHLALQFELGRMELKDEWHDLEAKWDGFERSLDEFGDDAKETVHRVGEEIEGAYRDLKQRLKDR